MRKAGCGASLVIKVFIAFRAGAGRLNPMERLIFNIKLPMIGGNLSRCRYAKRAISELLNMNDRLAKDGAMPFEDWAVDPVFLLP